MGDTVPSPDFDVIARPYRRLEYLTLGKALERCRFHYLEHLSKCRNALILGDGDGRFTSALLTANPHINVTAIDTSAVMLKLLRQRCEAVPNAPLRLNTRQANALTVPLDGEYDLVVTHFFLDCLTQSDLESLVARITPTLTPDALWLVSDFRVPDGPMRFPAWLLVRALYLAFRLLTGLRTTRLPDHVTPLTQAGFTRTHFHRSLAGILTTELWQRSAR